MDARLNSCFSALVSETDHYLSFFKQRILAEEQYAEILSKMTLKVEDGIKDTARGTAHSSVRNAWVEVVRDTLQLSEAHRLAAGQMRQRIYEPLSILRDSHERTRKRCRDELKASCNEYSDYKTAVHHFQKVYTKHCAELAVLQQQHDHTSTSVSALTISPTSDADDSWASHPRSRSNSPPPSPKALEIVSGVTASSHRDMLPPTAPSTAVARASEAFKKSSQSIAGIVGKLGGDSSASVTVLSTSSSPHGYATAASAANGLPTTLSHNPQSFLKVVKAKKEAEQADIDYRRSIYHLETLRLQKDRVHRSTRQSTLDFVVELGQHANEAIADYCDILESTNVASTSVSRHSLEASRSIQPDVDAVEYSAKITLDGAIDLPVLYENAYVGRCRSLVFGVPLDTHSTAFSPVRLIPRIVELCIQAVEQKLLEHPAEGLYRISPSTKVVQKLVLDIEKDENVFAFGPNVDINATAAILKLFLRRLPQPLCAMPTVERINLSTSLFSDNAQDADAAVHHLSKRIKRLNPAQQATLGAVVRHLTRCIDFEDTTKMNASSLCLLFTPCVFESEDALINDKDAAKDRLLEGMMKHHEQLFNRDLTQSRSRSNSSTLLQPRASYDEEFPMRTSSHLTQAAPARRSFSVKRKPPTSPIAESMLGVPAAGERMQRPASPEVPRTSSRSNSAEEYLNYSSYAEDGPRPVRAIAPNSLPPGAAP